MLKKTLDEKKKFNMVHKLEEFQENTGEKPSL